MPQTPLEKAVAAAIAIRDKRNEIKREHDDALEAADAPLREKYDRLNLWIREQLENSGGNSIKTDAGTVFFKENKKAGVADWNALAQYIRDTGEVDLLTHSVSKSAVEQHIKDSDGEIPPGVTWNVERSLNLRKPTSK